MREWGHAECRKAAGPSLPILDLMWPGLDRIEICRTVRQFSQLPILMLTARVDEIDRLLSLDTGAHAYLCKPFGPREVMATARLGSPLTPFEFRMLRMSCLGVRRRPPHGLP
jgi:DNA-binding response OmpR family regulator